MVACLAWAATNFQDASVYIADAPYERLATHRRRTRLGVRARHQGLHRMQDAARIASTVRGIGLVLLLRRGRARGRAASSRRSARRADPVRLVRQGQARTGPSNDTRRPVADNVTYAVRRSGPPKHTLVTIGSPATSPDRAPRPSGEMTVSAPVTSVATTTLPSPSMPSESNSCIPGSPQSTCARPRPSTSPGPGHVPRVHATGVRLGRVQARSRRARGRCRSASPTGTRPRVIDEPSGCA